MTRCEKCGSTVFQAYETWKIRKFVTIDTSDRTVSVDDLGDEEWQDGDFWFCDKGHRFDDIRDELWRLDQELRWN